MYIRWVPNHFIQLARIFSVCLTLILSGFLFGCDNGKNQHARVDGPRPNIIFILIDTLRTDPLGTYGDQRGLSKTFDDIAAEGVVFEHAIAASPWTQPSVASLFCSYYPGVHQVLSFQHAVNATRGNEQRIAVFSDVFVTLGELLQERGYATAAFVANPFILPPFGFAQGFDHFDASFASNNAPGSLVNQAANDWLEHRKLDQPFFLYLHYMDVHGPYDSRPDFLADLLDVVDQLPNKQRLSEQQLSELAYLRRLPSKVTDPDRHERLAVYREYWVARYEAGIREMDLHLADLKARLSAMNLWGDAYVILISDHGESFYEHGYWDHGQSLHQSELHVPLVFRWPDVLPPGQRISHTVSLIDVMPTIAEQLDMPQIEGIQGISLAPLFKDPDPLSPRQPVFAEGVKYKPELKALFWGDWKTIFNIQNDNPLLFNLTEDPREQYNRAGTQQQQVQKLHTALARQLETNNRLGAEVPARYSHLTPEQLEQLRSLGYIK